MSTTTTTRPRGAGVTGPHTGGGILPGVAVLTLDTPAGPFTALVAPDAVIGAGFTRTPEDLLRLVHPTVLAEPTRPTTPDARLTVDTVAAAVGAYFAGDLTAIDRIPVRQASGGPFREQVWHRLRLLPAGRPVTYTRLAELAGRPAAVRAAASACASNAVSLFVPCHRVLRTDGGLGGYLWGTAVKKRLLGHEGTGRR